MLIQYTKEMVKKGLSSFFKNVLHFSVNDHIPLESIENIVIKHRPEDNADKIAVFQSDWALQSHTVNLVASLAGVGFNVDLFLYHAPADLVDMGRINNNGKIKIYDLSNFPKSPNLLDKYAMLFRGNYLFLVGVEKGGLSTAVGLSERFRVPAIYVCLELYTDGHMRYLPGNWMGRMRQEEARCLKRTVAAIVQDRFRAERLYSGIEMGQGHRTLYFPVSVSGAKNFQKNDYFHSRFNIDASKKILLYFGLIQENRFCLELARLSRTLPDEYVMVFHGYFRSDEDRRAVEAYGNDRLIISTDLVGQKEIPRLISSADIGLVFYRNDCINERLTAFSSEKVALFMQSGIPIISFSNETYSELFSAYTCGTAIDSLDSLNSALPDIMGSYGQYREQAHAAYDAYYDFDSNFRQIKNIFLDKP